MLSLEARLAIRSAQGSIRQVARSLGVDPKTVVRWRSAIADDIVSRTTRSPRILSSAAEMRLLRFRMSSALALDDCLYASQVAYPLLTRSTLYRTLRRRRVARLQDLAVFRYVSSLDPSDRLGVISLHVTEAKAPGGSYLVYCAIDHATKLTLMRTYVKTDAAAPDFLQRVRAVLPFSLRTILHLQGNYDLFASEAFACAVERSGAAVVTLSQSGLADLGQIPSLLAETTQPDIAEIRRRIAAFLPAFNFDRRIMQLGGLRPVEALDRLCGARPAQLIRERIEEHFVR